MQRIKNIDEVILELKPLLKQYLEEQGTQFRKQLFQCPNRGEHSNNDETPSAGFIPGTEETVWNCFSCGSSGDIFTAYKHLEEQEINGAHWYIAVKELADRYGVEYELEPLLPEEQEFNNVQTFLKALIASAHKYVVKKEPEITNYIQGRKWEQAAEYFEFGYIPKGTRILDFVTNAFNTYPEIGKHLSIDLTRPDIFVNSIVNRLIYPIKHRYGYILGIISRSISEEDSRPKYHKYYTKQTEKGGILFNLTKVYNTVYVVEGASSVFTLHSRGIKNVVAVSGAFLTEAMYNSLVKNGVNSLILCFDGDKAGREGLEKAIKITEDKSDTKVYIKILPEGKDPDDIVKESGVEVFKKIPEISNFKYQLLLYKEAKDQEQDRLKASLFEIIVSRKDAIMREKMIKLFSSETGILKTTLGVEIEKHEKTKGITVDVGVGEILREEGSLLTSIETFEEKAWRSGKLKGIATGFPIFDEKIDGLQTGLILVAGKWNTGKCLREGTEILLNNGQRKPIEQLEIGERLAHPTEEDVHVKHRWCSGIKDTYRITFTDGEFIDTSLEHRFPCVFDSKQRSRGEYTLRTVGEIKEYLDTHVDNADSPYYSKFGGYGRYAHKVHVQDAMLSKGSVKWEHDPYLVGALLGDGTIGSSLLLHTHTKEVSKWEKYFTGQEIEHRVYTAKTKPNVTVISLLKQRKLREFLTKCNHYTKQIPLNFLQLTFEDRKRLLAGLVDTDGYTCKIDRSLDYYTVSPVLAQQVKDLAYSLGARVTQRVVQGAYKKNGKKIICKLCYSTRIYLFDDLPLLLKQQRKTKRKIGGRQIKKVEYIGKYNMYDIEVTSSDHLFITGNWVLSHNSAYLQSLILNILIDPTNYILYFSIDDPVVGTTIPRLLANLSSIPINIISNPLNRIDKNETMEEEEKKILKERRNLAINSLKSYSGRLGLKDANEGYDTDFIEKIIKIYKVRAGNRKLLVFVDFLNMVVSKKATKSMSTTDKETELAGFFKHMAGLYDVPVVCTVESTKGVADNKMGEADIKGSASIQFRSDLTLLLSSSFETSDKSEMYFYDERGVAQPIVKLQVSKNKMSDFRKDIYYKFHRLYSRFEECNIAEQSEYKRKK